MQSTGTRTKKPTEKSTGKSTKSTNNILKPACESASKKSTGWSPTRTSKDDYRVPMNVGCKIYSTDHAEALHRAQTALAGLNLVSITI